MSTPPAEADAEEDSGGWGLSSVSAAFGGWGLAAAAEPATASGDADETNETSTTSAAHQDDEWKRQAHELEDAAATAAHELEDAAAAAAAAASSFFADASNYFMSGDATEGEPDAAAEPTATARDKNYNDEAGGGAAQGEPDALRQILDLNPLNSIASHWIDALEQQSEAQDPHRPLRQHLDAHLVDWPKSTYEEWVEEALVAIEGWDRGSAVVDETFYGEGNVHRNLWNERMAADDPDAGGLDGGDEGEGEGGGGDASAYKKRYVPAKGATAVGAPATPARETTTASKAAPTAATAANTTAARAAGGDDADDDLAGLLGEATALLASTATAAAGSSAKDDDEDADLAGLLGGDGGDEEVVFVSPPSSGGVDVP